MEMVSFDFRLLLTIFLFIIGAIILAAITLYFLGKLTPEPRFIP